MFYLKEIKVLSLIAASSFAFLTGNSLKASEDYPSGIYGTMSIGAGEITNFVDTKSIVESFKEKSSENIKLKNLNFGRNYGKSLKFKGFY